jgi:hypothetical protein
MNNLSEEIDHQDISFNSLATENQDDLVEASSPAHKLIHSIETEDDDYIKMKQTLSKFHKLLPKKAGLEFYQEHKVNEKLLSPLSPVTMTNNKIALNSTDKLAQNKDEIQEAIDLVNLSFQDSELNPGTRVPSQGHQNVIPEKSFSSELDVNLINSKANHFSVRTLIARAVARYLAGNECVLWSRKNKIKTVLKTQEVGH